MRINRFTKELLGNDLRSAGNTKVVDSVTDQESFDELFELVFHHERPLVMKAVDAVEKITLKNAHYLKPHRAQLLGILASADHKELKWHIAQLITRIQLDKKELIKVWHVLKYWALNRNESKIVRVNSLHGLYELSREHHQLRSDYQKIVATMRHEKVPSIQARIRKLERLAATT